MTSTAAYKLFLYILNKNARGNVIIEQFESFLNDMQLAFFKENLPVGGDADSMGTMARFMVPFISPVVNGIASFDPSKEMEGKPVLWVMGYENPPCGEAAGKSYKIPVPVLQMNEFISIDQDSIDFPTFTRPYATLVAANKFEVAPREISHLHGYYWRRPKQIVVGRDPLTTFPAEEPLEGGAGQVDPEWSDIDCHIIIKKCLELAGVKLQDPNLFQAGQALERGGQR